MLRHVIRGALINAYTYFDISNIFQKKELRESGLLCIATAFQRIRREGLYEAASRRGHIESVAESMSMKEKTWRDWASQEALRRSILGYYILDGLMADLSGRPTTVRHLNNILPIPSDDALFHAATADEWLTEIQKQGDDGLTFSQLYESILEGKPIQCKPLSCLTIRVILEGVHSCVGEHKSKNPRTTREIPSLADLYNVLIQLRLDHILRLSPPDRIEHEIRWHVICINVVLHLLETQQHLNDPAQAGFADCVNTWMSSLNLRCALLHSTAILDLCQQLSLGRSLCMHIPSALFAAATVYTSILHCLVQTKETQCLWIPDIGDWDDVRRLVFGELPSTSNTLQDGSAIASFLSCSPLELSSKAPVRNLRSDITTMLGLLQQLSVYMGISRELGDTVTRWLSCLQSRL